MCFDSGDPPDAWTESHPKARKEHRCSECGGTIAKGEIYHRASYIFEGTPGSWKECGRCEVVRSEIAEIEQQHGCDGPEAWCPIGELVNALTDSEDGYGFIRYDEEGEVSQVTRQAAHLFPEAEVCEV